MMEHGSVRNLEQIQESDHDSEGRTPRGVTILLVALGGRRSAPTNAKIDPLGDLVTQAGKPGASGKPMDLSTKDVTFPGILSDEGSPTTALAAVKGKPGTPEGAVALNVPVGTPPPPTDRLPVVPLPAQQVLEASPVVTRPRDSLTRAASEAAQISAAEGPAASAGHEGGFQLQVSSFRTQGEADQFANQLRARGHKAYVVEAHVPQRGTWYRVRIGPFTSQHAASAYRTGFEGREHVVPFIVPPTAK
jgi:cell division septation protein DedD